MGQKTNPTALRLEKTNQHFKSIWYSDRFYCEQLHSNYKIEDYITKVFYKIRRMGVSLYSKCGYKVNHVFCIFPKRKKRFHPRKHRIPKQNVFLSLSHNYKSPQTKFKKHGKKPYQVSTNPALVSIARSWHSQKTINHTLRPTALLAASFQRKISALRNNAEISAFQGLVSKARLSTLLQGVTGFLPPQRLAGVCKDYSRCSVQGKNSQQSSLMNYCNTWFPFGLSAAGLHLYFIKASFPQQSCQFLAQLISNGLKHRLTFQRLRKQVLRDVQFSPYIKGVRVTLSGRVESRSKKAQKARSRTFQWGQTELHVFSSLVQFTSQPCITPFGKIGIKIWLCYGRLT